MLTAEVTCPGCWKIRVLGFSTRTYKQIVVNAAGEVKAIVERLLPAHGKEVCPTCNAVHYCGPLGGYLSEEKGLIFSSDEDRYAEPEKTVRYLYRGPIERPVGVEGRHHWLPEQTPDLGEESWL